MSEEIRRAGDYTIIQSLHIGDREAKILAEQEYSRGNVCWKDSNLELRSVQKEAERGDER